MGDVTKIEWTHHTFNPWWGCARVSPACRFCYADRDAKRYGHDVWRRKGPRRMLSNDNWKRPLKWNRDAEKTGLRARVFCASMADVFEDHPQVVEPRARLWPLIEQTPWLDWQLLTKRPENVAGMVPWGSDWPGNVWLGTSVENQRYADERIPVLLQARARVHFLSCEPLIGPVDVSAWLHESVCPYKTETVCTCQLGDVQEDRVNWVICGGESGPKARPMHPDWTRSLRDQCQVAGVPYLFKQWGEWLPLRGHREHLDLPAAKSNRNWSRPFGDDVTMCRIGKKAAGRVLDGQAWDEFPEVSP